MYIYFVSYHYFRTKDDKGFAMTSVVLEKPVSTWQDIEKMSYACERQSGVKSAVILSFHLLPNE